MSSTNSNKNGEGEDRLALMQQNLSTEPKILSKSAGRSSCCIYRTPRNLMDVNGRSCQPQIVSIGPYHHGLKHLKMIEEHKWRFLSLLLNRIQTKNLTLEDLLKVVQPLESRTRDCYSETLPIDHGQLIEILVLDGCFIIELLRKVVGLVPFEADDPLGNMTWIFSTFLLDLIRLENQIPFFVLDCLFKLTQLPGEESGPSLTILTLNFFNSALKRPDNVIAKYRDLKGKHILDLLRSSYFPLDQSHTCAISEEGEGWYMVLDESHTRAQNTHLIHSVSKLQRKGIKLNPGHEDSFLDIKFIKGVIEMPTITIDDFMSSFLLNCVAYEQCHRDPSKQYCMSAYAVLLDCLINTSRDVGYLSEQNIIKNYLGTDGEAAKFINDLAKHVDMIHECYLAELSDDVNRYYNNNSIWESFKNTYFRTPWSFISSLAALVLLVFTVLQTVNTIIG